MARSLVQTVGNTAALRPSEGAGTTTLTVADKPHQIFNLTAARTCLLPSVGVRAGSVWRIENPNAFDLSLQSSAAEGVIDCRSGYILVQALQDTPTLAAHWSLLDVQSLHMNQLFAVTNMLATTTNIRLNIARAGNLVTVVNSLAAIASPGKINVYDPETTVAIPVQYRPPSAFTFAVHIKNNAIYQLGVSVLSSTGLFLFYLAAYNADTWTSGTEARIMGFTASYPVG